MLIIPPPEGSETAQTAAENLQTFKGEQNKDEHGGEAPLGDPGVSAWRPPDLGGQLANCDRSPRCADLEVLSVTDVARIFGRTERTIRNWVRAGHLQRSGFGRSVFFTRAAIEALLQSAPRGEDDQSTSK
jgi:Helix-turn-helix domain